MKPLTEQLREMKSQVNDEIAMAKDYSEPQSVITSLEEKLSLIAALERVLEQRDYFWDMTDISEENKAKFNAELASILGGTDE